MKNIQRIFTSFLNMFHDSAGTPGLNVRVVTTSYQAAAAYDELVRGEDRFLGVDCEWNMVTKRGQPLIPDLLQVARSDGFCVLVRLNVFQSVPPPFRDLLEDERFWKLGVGVIEDTQKLRQGFGVTTRGGLDIRFLAKAVNIKPKGMEFLTERVLGVKKRKLSPWFCWTKPRLSQRMVEYAAADAVNAVRIFDELNRRKMELSWGNGWKQWRAEKCVQETVKLWRRFVGKIFKYREEFNDLE